MREAILGPVGGHYVAVRAFPSADGTDEFLAGFRVFPFRPGSFGDEGHIVSHACKARYPSVEVALHHARLKGAAAAEQLACEPPG
ncbi:hypothetical protein [Ramlibacter albus]|uniref:Uncharacterized protein n=1 Tax=Ramlibacter albus TaxID=2079448 RepID=A0A923MAF4_9BURK|nr:hypothetical protein [Ramlibacter albus]MBC5765733.1 hypothetical protein [Ramlibacter albus]